VTIQGLTESINGLSSALNAQDGQEVLNKGRSMGWFTREPQAHRKMGDLMRCNPQHQRRWVKPQQAKRRIGEGVTRRSGLVHINQHALHMPAPRHGANGVRRDASVRIIEADQRIPLRVVEKRIICLLRQKR